MILRPSIMRQRLTEKKPMFVFKANIAHPMIPELLAGQGMDCLWFDCEHFPTTTETMAILLQVSRGCDADSMVRVPNGEFLLAAKMLDCGADAILYPRCRGPQELRDLVNWTRFAPLGRRGADNGIASAGFSSLTTPQAIERGKSHTTLVVQIETPEALEKIDEIAAVKGIDILILGPGDLSVELGCACDPADPTLAGAIDKVAAAARRHNIAWGMPALSFEHARQIQQAGALFLSLGSDSSILAREVAALRKRFTELGVPFGRS